MNYLKETDSHLFFTKNDPADPRLGERAVACNLTTNLKIENSFIIYGYPDDEGIALNGGRIGAKEAPDKIRNFLYRMTPSVSLKKSELKEFQLLDLGNLNISDLSLSDRHESGRILANQVSELCKKHKTHFIALGGGHDYGYCEATGFCQSMLKSGLKPVVINFDAHLDVRPSDKGFNSGTPFYRLLNEFSNQIHFLEVGIQDQCNSREHYEWAESKGAHIVALNQLKSKLTSLCKKSDPVFISLDIDAFSSSIAPGCSQAWAKGFNFDEFDRSFSELLLDHNVMGIGIYEVSPPLDFDNHTSKLAALILHKFIHTLSVKNF